MPTPGASTIVALAALLLVGLAASPAAGQGAGEGQREAGRILLGPALGHVDTDHALLWLRASGVLDLAVHDGERERRLPFWPIGRGFGNVRVDGLTPDTEYTLRVGVPGAEGEAFVFRTAPPPRAWGKVRFALGSCAGFDEQPVWDHVLRAEPDLFLWLGDNTYYSRRPGGGADWERLEWMVERQVTSRSLPNLQRAMRRMACYATWDDHDYGPNDADGTFPLRAEARLVHRYMWANPSYGEDDEGVYFSFRRGPLEFFLLDDRSFKDVDPGLPAAERRLYGEKQLAWLRRGLEASTAPLKVIASGVQQLLGYPGAEGWHQAPGERRGFLDWFQEADLGPVLFLSGDVHVSELYHVPLGDGRYAWELTSSALAQGNELTELFRLLGRPERRWLVTVPNFCLVEVDIPEDPARLGEATIRFLSIGADGELMAETETTLASFERVRPSRRRF